MHLCANNGGIYWQYNVDNLWIVGTSGTLRRHWKLRFTCIFYSRYIVYKWFLIRLCSCILLVFLYIYMCYMIWYRESSQSEGFEFDKSLSLWYIVGDGHETVELQQFIQQMGNVEHGLIRWQSSVIGSIVWGSHGDIQIYQLALACL